MDSPMHQADPSDNVVHPHDWMRVITRHDQIDARLWDDCSILRDVMLDAINRAKYALSDRRPPTERITKDSVLTAATLELLAELRHVEPKAYRTMILNIINRDPLVDPRLASWTGTIGSIAYANGQWSEIQPTTAPTPISRGRSDQKNVQDPDRVKIPFLILSSLVTAFAVVFSVFLYNTQADRAWDAPAHMVPKSNAPLLNERSPTLILPHPGAFQPDRTSPQHSTTPQMTPETVRPQPINIDQTLDVLPLNNDEPDID